MKRRWKVAAVGLIALLLCVIGLLWRRPDPAPKAERPRAAAHAKPRRHARNLEVPTRPSEQAEEADPRPMAVPAQVDTASLTIEAPELHTVLVLAQYANGDMVHGAILVQSRDCGIWLRAEGGKPVPVTTDQPSCTLKVGRKDGLLFAWSDLIEVDTSVSGAIVDVVIPQEETGGLGVAFAPEEGGMRVEHVWPGSPADRMGLAEGDLIVEVDGLPTETLTEDEFISVMTGPVGTDVDFVVGNETDSGWDEEELVLTRERVE